MALHRGHSCPLPSLTVEPTLRRQVLLEAEYPTHLGPPKFYTADTCSGYGWFTPDPGFACGNTEMTETELCAEGSQCAGRRPRDSNITLRMSLVDNKTVIQSCENTYADSVSPVLGCQGKL